MILLNYIFIDLEYNQPFDFGKNGQALPNDACPFEIVQMGLVKFNQKLEITGQRSYLIKPRLYKKIHPYVARITGFNEKTLAKGQSFEEVYRSFLRFLGREKAVFCTWGGADIRELYRNALFYGLKDRKLPKRYIDVQKLVGRHLGNGKNCIGLENAVEAMGIEKSLPFHDALNDAIYAGELFRKVKPLTKPDKKGKSRFVQKINLRKLKDSLRRLSQCAE